MVLYGANIGEARQEADRLAAAHEFTYINGFDDPDVIAGAGSLGLEILEQVPEPDAIVVPIGGAGLIAGLALAVKTMRPETQIIGVEPAFAASYTAALAAGGPVQAPVEATLGDGLAVPRVGDNAFEIARRFVDRVVLVDEAQIAVGILRILEMDKGLVEGAGAAPVAAMLSGQLDDLKGKRVVLTLCGGNIDPAVLDRVIDFGLVADGRLARFSVVISDRPGGLAALTRLIADAGASVKQIEHERAFASADMSKVTVVCTVETRDQEHVETLRARISEAGFVVG